MKKIIYLSLLAVSVSACSTFKKAEKAEVLQPALPSVVLTNAVDSMSYSLGVSVGNDFSKNLETIPGGKSNVDLLIKGFSQALKKDSTIIKLEDAQAFFQKYMAAEQKKESDSQKAKGEQFLAENKLKEGVKLTESGLQYIVLTEGKGKKPVAADKVKVHYTGTTMDGHVFDSSVERGEPIEFALNQVIPGWTEGVQLMPIGSKYKFFIPYNLAYGEQGVPQAGIPPFAPLVFEVELLDIVK